MIAITAQSWIVTLTDARDLADPHQDGYRRLAIAVLTLAVQDATSFRHGPTHDARRWLVEGGEDLAHWCAMAGVNAAEVQRAAIERWGDRVCAA